MRRKEYELGPNAVQVGGDGLEPAAAGGLLEEGETSVRPHPFLLSGLRDHLTETCDLLRSDNPSN